MAFVVMGLRYILNWTLLLVLEIVRSSDALNKQTTHSEHTSKNMNKIIDKIEENHCMQNIFCSTTIHLNLLTTPCISYTQWKREDY
jgi:hypothetical protein